MSSVALMGVLADAPIYTLHTDTTQLTLAQFISKTNNPAFQTFLHYRHCPYHLGCKCITPAYLPHLHTIQTYMTVCYIMWTEDIIYYLMLVGKYN